MSSKINKIVELYIKIEDMIQQFNNCYVQGAYSELQQGCVESIAEINQLCGDEYQNIQEPLCRIKELLINSSGEAKIYDAIKKIFVQYKSIVERWYVITIHSEETYNEELLENYYQTGYDKNALLIYILHPFIFPNNVPEHTNQVESKIIAEVLSNKHYNVDIINTMYNGKIEYSKYDVVIGYGRRMDEICHKRNANIKLIYYLTEASPYFGNIAELTRLRDFEKRNSYLPDFERLSMKCLDLCALIKADAAICVGNKWTLSTYQGMFNKIYAQKVTGFSDCMLPDLHKEEEYAVRNFLWYGGAGSIHKGLDLCIEAFRALPNLNLHIVGEVTTEFFQFYKNDIENAENIFYYGFLKKDTDEFRQVCEKCGFCLSPSCSEGQSTAILTTMFAGIIPVCTIETGIDVEEAGGFIIQSIALNNLIEMIKNLSDMKKEEFYTRQQQVYDYVMVNHTVDNYRSILEANLSKII